MLEFIDINSHTPHVHILFGAIYLYRMTGPSTLYDMTILGLAINPHSQGYQHNYIQ